MSDAPEQTTKWLALALVLLLLGGCTSETAFGPCIGGFDDRDPHLIYKVSGWNLAMAIVFIETIFVPIVVAVDETLCPIGRNEKGSEHAGR